MLFDMLYYVDYADCINVFIENNVFVVFLKRLFSIIPGNATKTCVNKL